MIRFTRAGREIEPEKVIATLFARSPEPVRPKPRPTPARKPKPLVLPETCETGKHRFESAAHAMRWLRNADLNRNKTTGKQPQRAYKCPACGDYHLTSRRKR